MTQIKRSSLFAFVPQDYIFINKISCLDELQVSGIILAVTERLSMAFVGRTGKCQSKEGMPMPTCKECKQFFPMEENPDQGDCVQRVVDPRQAYYKAKPVDVHEEAGDCPDFQRKP